MFNPKSKTPETMTSPELEQAIKDHQEYVRKLIEEVQLRRKKEAEDRKKSSDPSGSSC